MEVRSIAKNIRISPQKVKIVADQIRKSSPGDSINFLRLTRRSASKPLTKAILSAIANAKNNFNLDEGSLTFKSIIIEKGPVFKRYRPVSRGRAHPILKRTSHIKIVIEGQPKKAATTAATKATENKSVSSVVAKGDKNGTKS